MFSNLNHQKHRNIAFSRALITKKCDGGIRMFYEYEYEFVKTNIVRLRFLSTHTPQNEMTNC